MKIVYINQIGPGELSVQNLRTGADGRATVFFSPPADQIGKTRVVATYFVDGVANQAILEVPFTSTAIDASVVPEISDEQIAAEATIGAALNQAGLASAIGK